jgi:hypothetical protein
LTLRAAAFRPAPRLLQPPLSMNPPVLFSLARLRMCCHTGSPRPLQRFRRLQNLWERMQSLMKRMQQLMKRMTRMGQGVLHVAVVRQRTLPRVYRRRLLPAPHLQLARVLHEWSTSVPQMAVLSVFGSMSHSPR